MIDTNRGWATPIEVETNAHECCELDPTGNDLALVQSAYHTHALPRFLPPAAHHILGKFLDLTCVCVGDHKVYLNSDTTSK